jgi:hypothetical protein
VQILVQISDPDAAPCIIEELKDCAQYHNGKAMLG